MRRSPERAEDIDPGNITNVHADDWYQKGGSTKADAAGGQSERSKNKDEL